MSLLRTAEEVVAAVIGIGLGLFLVLFLTRLITSTVLKSIDEYKANRKDK